jgi:hypothetical protein
VFSGRAVILCVAILWVFFCVRYIIALGKKQLKLGNQPR